MTEAEEVARSLLPDAPLFANLGEAESYVRSHMPGESATVVAVVADELAHLRWARCSDA